MNSFNPNNSHAGAERLPAGFLRGPSKLLDGTWASWWVAAPADNGNTNCHYVGGYSGSIMGDTYPNNNGFRPVVCLKDNVGISLNSSTGKYELSMSENP